MTVAEIQQAVDAALAPKAPAGKLTFAVVHGATVDAHFYETSMNYMTYQQRAETERLSIALREAAGHIRDPKAKAAALEEASRPLFQEAFVGVRSGPLLSMGRGQVCQSYLGGTDNEYVLMSDSDMTWEPTVPRAMVQLADQEGLKCLSAVAWIIWTAPDGTILRRCPNVYKAVQHADGEYLHPVQTEELPTNGLCKVGAVGAAFMLVRRDLLEKIRKDICGDQPFWWHHAATPNGDQYGEDTSFSLRVRAAGEDIWVHTGIRVGHSKTIIQYGIDPEGTISNG